MSRLGQTLRQARTRQRLTVHELADRVSKTAGYISRIEGRGEVPTADLLLHLAEVLGLSPELLVQQAKADLLEKAKANADRRFDEALVLYRRSR